MAIGEYNDSGTQDIWLISQNLKKCIVCETIRVGFLSCVIPALVLFGTSRSAIISFLSCSIITYFFYRQNNENASSTFFLIQQAKLERQEYESLSAFESDFNLMVNNCLAYNRKDTMFYRAGLKMREQGGALIEQARKDYPELDPPAEVEPAPIVSKSRKRERNNQNRTESESQTGEPEVPAAGVNRRTAVLFTRKARARASRSGQTLSPESEQKKQGDSFRVYRYVGPVSRYNRRVDLYLTAQNIFLIRDERYTHYHLASNYEKNLRHGSGNRIS